jgi:hypothetical protein
MDAISLPHRKEMAKEKTPRRSLLELPWLARKRRCAVASLMFARIIRNSDFVFAF